MLADLLSHRGVIAVLYTVTVLSGLAWLGLQIRASMRTTEEAPSATAQRDDWWWLRWLAMVAFVGAWAIVTVRSARGVPFRVPSMTLLVTGVGVASIQWFNVWFVVWPGLRFGAARARARSVATLRLNAAMTVPVIFFFFASEFATKFGGEGRWIPASYWVATVAAYGAMHGVALIAPKTTGVCLRSLPVRLLVGLGLLGTLAAM